MMLKTR